MTAGRRELPATLAIIERDRGNPAQAQASVRSIAMKEDLGGREGVPRPCRTCRR